MLRAGIAFVALVGFVTPVVAAPPTSASPDPKSLVVAPEDVSKARALVQKLGSEAYLDREAAEHDLALMGRLARAAILDGVNTDPDPEIRARCRTLLPKATNEEMKARLATFKADVDGKYEHELPGWRQFRATVRGEWTMFGWTYTARTNLDKAARETFIEFMEAPGGRTLLLAMNGDPTAFGQLVATRKQELYNARFPRFGGPSRNPTTPEMAVVLFAESQVPSRLVPRSTVLTALVQQSGLPGLMHGTDDKAMVLRAVMSAWFDSRTEGSELYSAFSLASNMGLNDAVGRLATRLMTTPGVPGAYKGSALMTMVRLKMNDQVPAIEKAFTDTTVLTQVAQIVDGKRVIKAIEVRDAALAAALVMTGQDPNDYGFDAFPKTAPGGSFSYVWAKIHEDKRKDAFEKWNKWREKNP
jgi:hypothetical protein